MSSRKIQDIIREHDAPHSGLHASGQGGAGHHGGSRTGSYRLDQVSKHIMNGDFEHIVDAAAHPEFVKKAYLEADAAGKADIKVLAAVAIASHGEEIANGLRRNGTIAEIKNIPDEHIADVMKLSMKFGASSKSMGAFMNVLHETGGQDRVGAVLKRIFDDFHHAKASDVINITASIVKLGLDPTPMTCAQTALRLMSYALDHSGVDKNTQPNLARFVNTAANAAKLGETVINFADNLIGVGMVAGVSKFVTNKIMEFGVAQMAEKTERIKFEEEMKKVEKETVGQREEERGKIRGEVGAALKETQTQREISQA